MIPKPPPRPLTDTEAWDALHAALLALGSAPGETEIGEHILAQARTQLVEWQKVLLIRMDSGKKSRVSRASLVNLNLKVPPEIRPALDAFGAQHCYGASTSQTAVLALTMFLTERGYMGPPSADS